MVTLIKSPIGHKLSDSEITAVIIDSAGEALVYMATGHALSDGDYVYIQSNFDAYNGFKYVDSIAYDSFKIKDSENSDPVEYVQDADITYRTSVLNHGWQAVHNPIVYELESDISPNNVAEEAYTPTTVISQSEEGGLTRLALSVAISDPTELAKIKLVGDNELEGVYQIVTVHEAWNIVIDLPYDSTNSFTGLQVIKYYDNYAINVRVWAGYSSDHRWQALKPYEIAATLQLIPDADNRVKFSISEVLRSYITTRNNLTLNTLPNNTDFTVAFYIQYFESYDQSDGETITTFEDDPVTDDFIGYAVNAEMPFKSESVSHMSDYINEDVYLAQWLTLQDRPIGIVGRFFDLSFINQFNSSDIVVEITRVGAVTDIETITIVNPGYGVIRVPFTPASGFTEYCIEASTNGTPASGGVTSAMSIPALSTWISRNISGSLVNWTTGATPSVTLTGSFPTVSTSEILYCEFPFISGYTYSITVNYTKSYNSGSSNPRTVRLIAYDDSFNELQVELDTTPPSPGASDTVVLTFVSNGTETIIGIYFSDGSNVDLEINSVSGTQTTPVIPAVPAQVITERICMDILEECDNTFVPDVPDDIRLTEDGDFRILE